MGDLVQNNDIFKKLGFDSSNQWILYGDSFQKFFNWMSENISDENILTENEVLEERDLKHRKQYLESDDLEAKLKNLNKDYPSILKYTDNDVLILETELEQTKQACEMYDDLGNQMQMTKINLNRELHELDSTINEYENQVETVYNSCLQKSKELQELQKKNKKLCAELNECFTKSHSPPLFTHELPLDQYLLKCDSFMQYFTLYLQGNFKFQSFLETENEDPALINYLDQLENIKNQIFYYNEKFNTANARLSALKFATDNLDLNKIHITNFTELKKEIVDLENENENFEITCETLTNDLKLHLKQLAQQQIELILYENTKQKYEMATKRFDNAKSLAKIVSDAISNTELIWILMQLDSEKIKNRIDNTEQLQRENNLCYKRIDLLRQFQIISPNTMSEIFISQLTEFFLKDFNIKTYNSAKKCLQEYEKFSLLLDNSMKSLKNKQKYIQILDFMNDLNLLENVLRSYVYDGPIRKPIFENIQFLKPIFQSKINEEKIEKKIRQLRSEFQEKITVRMNSDKLWRYSQLLWIWFLTEPRKVLVALEEVRKIASNIPALTGVKILSGIKRK